MHQRLCRHRRRGEVSRSDGDGGTGGGRRSGLDDGGRRPGVYGAVIGSGNPVRTSASPDGVSTARLLVRVPEWDYDASLAFYRNVLGARIDEIGTGGDPDTVGPDRYRTGIRGRARLLPESWTPRPCTRPGALVLAGVHHRRRRR